jgi:hypothetical protein
MSTIGNSDTEINALFRKLDELKQRGEGGKIASAEYMKTLAELKEKTSARMTGIFVGHI